MMKVHHLNCGTVRPPSERLANGHGSYLRRGLNVCHCLLVETDKSGLVLIDSGFGLSDIRQPKRLGIEYNWILKADLLEEETAIRQIEKLGFSASDVRHVVLTHLDPDHRGGLEDFPNAVAHVSGAELHAARNPLTLLEKRRYQGEWIDRPKWATYETAGDNWHGFTAVRELDGLPPEILLIPLDGHTPGHSGIAIDTGATEGPRWLLHAGDSFVCHSEIEYPPTAPLGVRMSNWVLQSNQSSRLRNVSRLAALATDPAVEIFSAHEEAGLTKHLSAQVGHNQAPCTAQLKRKPSDDTTP